MRIIFNNYGQNFLTMKMILMIICRMVSGEGARAYEISTQIAIRPVDGKVGRWKQN